jgi:MoxR-like ATPase
MMADDARKFADQMDAELGRVIVGQRETIRQVATVLLCGGHALLEGVPGIAKTLIVKALARVCGLRFQRVQCAPDLMPADITGGSVYNMANGTFNLHRGPVFTDLLLVDEVNRMPPRTQAALLECMEERQVTIDGASHPLSDWFSVFATQNPVEFEGTYPLPEAQLDRFMFSLHLDYPAKAEEMEIVKRTTLHETPTLTPTISAEDLLRVQRLVLAAPVSDHVIDYAVSLAAATRPGNAESPQAARDFVEWGAGPRASQYLILGAKALALLRGKISPETSDVREVAMHVLQHRVITNYRATGAGMKSRDVVRSILTLVGEKSY